MIFSISETFELWKIYELDCDYFRACAVAGGKAPADITAHLQWNIKEQEAKTQVYCGRVFTEPEPELESNGLLIGEDTTRNGTDTSEEIVVNAGKLKQIY